jgi:hypothetical protein
MGDLYDGAVGQSVPTPPTPDIAIFLRKAARRRPVEDYLRGTVSAERRGEGLGAALAHSIGIHK